MRWISFGVVSLILLVSLVLPGPRAAAQDELCFTETTYCISGPIREYWEQNGGLAVFGLPLGALEDVTTDGRTLQAQWFERHRLELHPENTAPYNVLLGRIGADRLSQQGRDWRDFPPLDPNDADAENCRFFQETRHQVCGEFLRAFNAYGLNFPNTPGITYAESLALFGQPISEPMTETIEGQELTVQWFERARFELHPSNPRPYNVLFGRLGAEFGGGSGQPASAALAANSWVLESFGPANAPEAAAGDRPATLSFAEGKVSGTTGCNGFGGDYTATDTTISFGPLVGTLIACIDDVVTRQEQTIYSTLRGEVGYLIADGKLLINDSQGNQMLRYRAAPGASVRGTVTYSQRVALPPQAQIEVQLVDVSRADAPAVVLASTTIEAGGRQVPFSFELAYDPAQIVDTNSYAVQARITVDGELRFISTTRYSVITQGNPTEVTIVVEPV